MLPMTLITLCPQAREGLEVLVTGTHHAQGRRRARAWLGLAAAECPHRITARLCVTRHTIDHWLRRFQGYQVHDLTARLALGARRGRPRTGHGLIAPLRLAIIDPAPRPLGYRATVWTTILVTHDLGATPHSRVSRKSVSLAIARRGLRWKRPRHDLPRYPATWQPAAPPAHARSS